MRSTTTPGKDSSTLQSECCKSAQVKFVLTTTW